MKYTEYLVKKAEEGEGLYSIYKLDIVLFKNILRSHLWYPNC